MSLPDVWREKSDDEIRDAAKNLADYTGQARQVILAELRSRGLAEPPARGRPPNQRTSPQGDRRSRSRWGESPDEATHQKHPRTALALLSSFVLGVIAWVVPAYLFRPSHPDATLIEHIVFLYQGNPQFTFRTLAGGCFLLGSIFRRTNPLLLGPPSVFFMFYITGTAVSRNPGMHNLFPFEYLFDAIIGGVVTLVALLGQLSTKLIIAMFRSGHEC